MRDYSMVLVAMSLAMALASGGVLQFFKQESFQAGLIFIGVAAVSVFIWSQMRKP